MAKRSRSDGEHRPTARLERFLCAAAAACLVLSESPVKANDACDFASTMSTEAIDALAREPLAILRRHPDGGGLAEEVQAIMMSGQSGKFALLSAARTASLKQQEQIGRGIGRAYRQCLKSANSASEEIRDRVLRSGITRLSSAFQDEVDVLWTSSSGATLPPERPTDEIGIAPSDVFGSSVPSTNLTARDGPFALPPLSGPLPSPFEPIK